MTKRKELIAQADALQAKTIELEKRLELVEVYISNKKKVIEDSEDRNKVEKAFIDGLQSLMKYNGGISG